MKRLGVLTSGGDAPGMNAALRSIVLIARVHDIDVEGFRFGYQGLIRNEVTRLTAETVAGVQAIGGTLLGTARSKEFRTEGGREAALRTLQSRGIEHLIVIGGNGSLTGLQTLLHESEGGLQGIGIPASIDNDIGHTRLSIGVDTAVNTIVDACDKIADTAASHARVFVVEVMGRHCGYLAMASGLAAAANAVLFPEAGKSPEDLVETVLRAVRRAADRPQGQRQALILKAEGVAMSNAELERRVTERIQAEDVKMDIRFTSLGHVVRGGRPSALDRQVASRLAHGAVDGLIKGFSNRMAAWSAGRGLDPSVAVVAGNDPRVALIDLGVVLEETQAMLDGTSRFVAWRQQVLADLENVFGM